MATRVISTHIIQELDYQWIGLFMNVRTDKGILHRDCKMIDIFASNVKISNEVIDKYFGTLEERAEKKMADAKKKVKITDGKHYNNLKSRCYTEVKDFRDKMRKNQNNRILFKKKDSYFMIAYNKSSNDIVELLILG